MAEAMISRRNVEFVTVIVRPPDTPSLSIRLENHPLPGRPQNYRLVCERPGPPDDLSFPYGPDQGAEPEQWERPITPQMLEEVLALFAMPISMSSGAGTLGLDRPAYEVRFGDQGQGARYRWFGDAPR